jgi:hypothetical protein
MAGVRRKRRGGSTCANPLFVKWVEELRDDAIERGLKSHYSYSKVGLKGALVVDDTFPVSGNQFLDEIPFTSKVWGGGKNTR